MVEAQRIDSAGARQFQWAFSILILAGQRVWTRAVEVVGGLVKGMIVSVGHLTPDGDSEQP
ncbi:hypothetical protein [Saccharopolyspora phatthalungensis]|uniref:Uncharacterized protein n=1 Tax=Saccharopolyspora phatthalungensis TaxID=664693 RepID=A0A840Q2K1_9PSEU|nr:hypothetical protein [Saccharopolyspora phatthalungensis]MBB5152988.1 hypothetical protein [Saccharopolyspora phatthalungensis]